MTTIIDNATGNPIDGDYEHAPEVTSLLPIDTSDVRAYFIETRALFPNCIGFGTAMELGLEICERYAVIDERKQRHMAYRQQYQK